MLRKMTKEDRELFLCLSEQFYRSEAVSHRVPREYHERTFAEILRGDDYIEGYIFEHEGAAAGYALLAKSFSPEVGGKVVWIEEIYILSAFRSKGLSRELFAEMEKREDVARVRLEVMPGNTRAAALYERIGFERLGYVQYVKEKSPDKIF